MRRLAEGADVFIYDAQYPPLEYAARRRAGDIPLARGGQHRDRSGGKEFVLFHHDPDHSDLVIDKVVRDARNYYPKVRATIW